MNRQEAIAALRLKIDLPSPEQVSAAFDKLALRYPRQHFPERALTLETARDILLHPEKVVRALLDSDDLDLSWLTAYARTPPAESETSNAQLATILRPVLMGFEGRTFEELTQEGSFDEIMMELSKLMGD